MSRKISGPVHLKLCLLGDGKVGKTSLRRRYLGQGFSTEYLETLGADFAIKRTVFAGLVFRFQIWDIAGQPRFSELRKAFFMGSQAAIVLYDISNPATISSVDNWVRELWANNGKGPHLPIVIVGNKVDLRRKVDTAVPGSEGRELAEQLSEEVSLPFTIPFLETSALTGTNVDVAFQTIIQHFMQLHNLEPQD